MSLFTAHLLWEWSGGGLDMNRLVHRAGGTQRPGEPLHAFYISPGTWGPSVSLTPLLTQSLPVLYALNTKAPVPLQCDLLIHTLPPLHCSVLALCDPQEVPHLLWAPFKSTLRSRHNILAMQRGDSLSPEHMPSSPDFRKQPRKGEKKSPGEGRQMDGSPGFIQFPL